ncbi:unnamed protein product [Phaedon cochleariae]|uniref:Cell division cycle protein 123 homolog n=1 Tax=Phaedon cochleariae TaxID=80249 RepID=A0A9P0DLL2_PHACE|nr:unnamed protein product [Phaedon cochleariae]
MLEITDFRDFSISNWYDKFKHISMETIMIELPDELLKRIQADIILADDSEEESEPELQNQDSPEPLSAEFVQTFKNAMNRLNNSAFVKNNWHAPIDAKMFSFGNNLKVSNIEDVILYFTSSGVIQDDFSNIKGIPFCIALRKWISLHPAAEFRCIVINNVLRGITPRDWPTYYAHFKEEGPRIIEQLMSFYIENIKITFPRENYIFDVVFQYPDRPIVVDFGPLNSKTNLYAFSWKEIQPLMGKDVPEDLPPVFRYLETDIGIMMKADALNKFAKCHS